MQLTNIHADISSDFRIVTNDVVSRLMVRKTIKKPKKMKTRMNITVEKVVLIISILLSIFSQNLMAKSPLKSGLAGNESTLVILAPVTPTEATFSDVIPEKAPSMVNIAPVTPTEAFFEDTITAPEVSNELLKKVAPVTPKECGFDDLSQEEYPETIGIKFNTPGEASFSDF
jgi:hypothetical protein